MQEEFDIAARHLIYFIDMTPYLQKNDTTKVSSQTEVDIDGDSYYPYILWYAKIILFVHHDDMTMLKHINN